MKTITFPRTWTEVKRAIKSKQPTLSIRKAPLGKSIPTGESLFVKHGETPEEALAKYAPATAKSKPERMLYGWLIKHGISFEYQVTVAGGRAIPGGAVLDFVVYARATPIAIRIQSYWHKGAENILGDDIQLNMLQEIGYVVEDVYDWQISTVPKLENVMRQILYGMPKWREVS